MSLLPGARAVPRRSFDLSPLIIPGHSLHCYRVLNRAVKNTHNEPGRYNSGFDVLPLARGWKEGPSTPFYQGNSSTVTGLCRICQSSNDLTMGLSLLEVLFLLFAHSDAKTFGLLPTSPATLNPYPTQLTLINIQCLNKPEIEINR